MFCSAVLQQGPLAKMLFSFPSWSRSVLPTLKELANWCFHPHTLRWWRVGQISCTTHRKVYLQDNELSTKSACAWNQVRWKLSRLHFPAARFDRNKVHFSIQLKSFLASHYTGINSKRALVNFFVPKDGYRWQFESCTFRMSSCASSVRTQNKVNLI